MYNSIGSFNVESLTRSCGNNIYIAVNGYPATSSDFDFFTI